MNPINIVIHKVTLLVAIRMLKSKNSANALKY